MIDTGDIDVFLGLDVGKGEHHTQALLCLARRPADILFAMLRDGTFYEPQPAESG
ncbi:hypothetical protein [Streptomyces sp. ok210]|uniref:hypothetical protein n=1 Tax=Streptomyces sp. ok210 TaxID=1761905 RepID=UPI0008EBB5DA|nr:hypothetical protein [Streptomyces sp. ok210]SFT21316.1 hypothetical protein SAMN04487982_11068 [Streptomyces sp. ok210]